MGTIPELLSISLQQYRLLEQRTTEIGERVNELDVAEMSEYVQELSTLLENVKKTDAAINILVENNEIDIASHTYRVRYDLMETVRKLNEEVAAKLAAKKAVLMAEYKKIKTGRSGIVRYHSGKQRSRSLVNESA